MIWNQWYAVLDSKEVPKGKLIGVTRLGEKLVFWRDEQGNSCDMFDKCAHRGVRLSAGKIIHGEVQCPFHGLQYDHTGKCTIIPSRGKVAEIPSNFKVHSYPIREAHGFIWIWWGDLKIDENYPPLPFFDDIDDSFSYVTQADYWKVHYSRAIENQLDVSHLPFVHHNTIGAGHQTICDGPYTVAEKDGLRVWVFSRKEDGTPSKLPEELTEPNDRALLYFKFPNIWQNKLAEKVRIMVSFTPVDEENCILYLRFYHKIVRIPGLRGLISHMGRKFSVVIAHQDRRVVETQDPKKTSLKMKENLFPADRPIAIYRRIRQELKEKNNPPEKI
jgi:phenylpropionate dioxygenase-like ring-hydroxylating dioxygenase large terminal subunit